MENATKALLIAAAILIAIIIISFGIFVVNQGQEAVQGADLSEAEAAQFNAKFRTYEGSNVSTAQVRALLNTVFSHNQNETAAGTNRFVSVTAGSGDASPVSLATSGVTSVPQVGGNSYFVVTCNYTGTIITSITVDRK